MKISLPVFVFSENDDDLAWFQGVEEAAKWLEPVGLNDVLSCDSDGRRVNYLVKPHSNESWYNGRVLFGNIESDPTQQEALAQSIINYLVTHHAQDANSFSKLPLERLVKKVIEIAGNPW